MREYAYRSDMVNRKVAFLTLCMLFFTHGMAFCACVDSSGQSSTTSEHQHHAHHSSDEHPAGCLFEHCQKCNEATVVDHRAQSLSAPVEQKFSSSADDSETDAAHLILFAQALNLHSPEQRFKNHLEIPKSSPVKRADVLIE